jgi:hypothetical protein
MNSPPRLAGCLVDERLRSLVVSCREGDGFRLAEDLFRRRVECALKPWASKDFKRSSRFLIGLRILGAGASKDAKIVNVAGADPAVLDRLLAQ